MYSYRQPREYNDGLDDDGYAIKDGGWRKPYVHGCEKDAGNVELKALAEVTVSAIDRINHCQNISPTSDSPIETIIGGAILMFFGRALSHRWRAFARLRA